MTGACVIVVPLSPQPRPMHSRRGNFYGAETSYRILVAAGHLGHTVLAAAL